MKSHRKHRKNLARLATIYLVKNVYNLIENSAHNEFKFNHTILRRTEKIFGYNKKVSWPGEDKKYCRYPWESWDDLCGFYPKTESDKWVYGRNCLRENILDLIFYPEAKKFVDSLLEK